ncbi:HNH endonuclease [Streptomyces canus]|uniref:HNH endonuclease n=1 Tax=Streptomyces canus TaxID=58343 RepID=UPI0036B8DC4F
MAVSQRKRFEVLRRDGFRCRYCGAGAATAALEVDHVTPVALGGTDDLGNLVTSCGPCNDGKASTVPDETVKAALQATAPTTDAVKLHEMLRLAWSVLVEYGPRRAVEPVSDDNFQHAVMNTLGMWCYGWDAPGPDSKGERPDDEQMAKFTRSVHRAIEHGASAPVLWAAAQAAGWERATVIDVQLAAVQDALHAELARLK